MENVSNDLKNNVSKSTDIDGIIEYELRKQKKLFNIESDQAVNANFTFPELEQIKTSAMFKPVTDNMTYESYLNGIENGLYTTWDSAVRTGYMTGETTSQMVKSVMGSQRGLDKGVMSTFRNSVYRNTRTVLQSFASETRMEIYKANSQYIQKLKFMATLDRRTCPVCGSMDGKLYDIEKAPQLPIHYNCRCVLVPKIVGVDNVADVRPMEGGVTGGSVTYGEWLGTQPAEVQKEILGVSRYKLYQKGYTIDSFVQGEQTLTLKELNDKLN